MLVLGWVTATVGTILFIHATSHWVREIETERGRERETKQLLESDQPMAGPIENGLCHVRTFMFFPGLNLVFQLKKLLFQQKII